MRGIISIVIASSFVSVGAVVIPNSTVSTNSTNSDSLPPYDPPEDYNVLLLQEFNESSLNETLWSFEEGFLNFNGENQVYTRDDVKVQDGHLVFTARYNATDNGWYSSRINTRDTFNFTYGRFEVRLKTSIAQGMFPAAWLLGYGEWALCGEMDLFEYTKAWESPDGKPQTPFTVHTAARNAANADTRQVLNDPTEFHVYGLEWEEERVVFYLDGEEKFRVERPDVSVRNDTNWPFYRPQYLILNLAIAPDFGRFQDPPADPQVLNGQQYVVDWVRVMQKNRLNETAID